MSKGRTYNVLSTRLKLQQNSTSGRDASDLGRVGK
jgi:hypothetical protein